MLPPLLLTADVTKTKWLRRRLHCCCSHFSQHFHFNKIHFQHKITKINKLMCSKNADYVSFSSNQYWISFTWIWCQNISISSIIIIIVKSVGQVVRNRNAKCLVLFRWKRNVIRIFVSFLLHFVQNSAANSTWNHRYVSNMHTSYTKWTTNRARHG